MIEVTLFQQNGELTGFTSAGHAGYDDEGLDIVCSAVSALTQTAVAAAADAVGEEMLTWEMEKGYLSFSAHLKNPEKRQKVALLLRALQIGLIMIQEQYPEYVSIRTREDGR